MGVGGVEAVDNDPEAVRTCIENCELNQVRDDIKTSLTPVGELAGAFGLVVANIIAPVLIALSRDICAKTAQGGTLILSGVLEGQCDEVLAAYNDAAKALGRDAPEVRAKTLRDEWAVLTLGW